ncbi:ABC transporter ATP-binding protein [Sneathiella chinensis]|nr:ABC transporter ATP-binding protein [Sneathiella chinensis]
MDKTFGGLRAVDDFHMSLDAGSLTAIVGPNGCGKSTLFNLITGALTPDRGTILFKGRDITGLPPHKIARLGIGRKFQVPAVFGELSVRENLALPAMKGRITSIRNDTNNARTTAILDQVLLTDKADWKAEHLSHGEKQWLEIGMLLAQAPELILLDEPTAGMTAAETAATAALIRQINQTGGITVLVIEHDIRFIEQLECPLLVMAKGQILKSGNFQSIRQDEQVQELYFGRTEAPHA